jgi:hypothetical protein
MLAALRARLWGAPPEPGSPTRLPPELVHAIGAADVHFRPSRDPDGADRVLVRMPTVGSFAFDGTTEAADRIAAAWPEITPSQARQAAQMLAGEVAMRSRLHVSGRAAPRRGFVHTYGEYDLAKL